jgi:hypothetical protein
LQPILARLKAFWHAGGLLGEVAGDEELRRFEADLGAELPAVVRAYYTTVGGTGASCDEACITFFSLAETESLRALSERHGGSPDYTRLRPEEATRHHLVLAEYLIWSHVYVVDVRRPSAPVYWCCGGTIEPLASTFEEFLEAYLADVRTVLLPPEPRG